MGQHDGLNDTLTNSSSIISVLFSGFEFSNDSPSIVFSIPSTLLSASSSFLGVHAVVTGPSSSSFPNCLSGQARYPVWTSLIRITGRRVSFSAILHSTIEQSEIATSTLIIILEL
ncbi:hypothetical protein PENTCL1PPCAC_23035, partial [Pristionchus entomophagus]